MTKTFVPSHEDAPPQDLLGFRLFSVCEIYVCTHMYVHQYVYTQIHLFISSFSRGHQHQMLQEST